MADFKSEGEGNEPRNESGEAMKRPVQWHKEFLVRWWYRIAEEQEHIDQLAHGQINQIARADALEAQIARAEKEGLDAFDAELYNVKREKP